MFETKKNTEIDSDQKTDRIFETNQYKVSIINIEGKI